MTPTEQKDALRRDRVRLVEPARPLNGPGAGSSRAERGLVRMALDLHDGPLQDLAAAAIALDLLDRKLQALPGDTAAAAEALASVRRGLASAEAGLRSLAEPESGETSTAIELIEREVTRFKTICSARVEVAVVGNIELETRSQHIVLHRVVREALSNVARHSQATEVRISLVEGRDRILLQIVDNGIGFDPRVASSDDSRPRLGLEGMRRRLELLDGTLTIETSPGGPTTVTAGVQRWRPEEATAGSSSGAAA